MGCMLYYPEVYFLTNIVMSDNPSKKMRLDFQNKKDRNVGNEDLWGQDDLTAEEFDMLEIQATQSCNQNLVHQNHISPNKTGDRQNNFHEVEDLKQLQYELEGRVKLLSHSLEKSARELSEERLNRERLIKERMKEFNEREANLRKEVERMQSILEFKDQEMKSTNSKLHMMKSHLQARKSTSTETEVNINFEDALKRSKFDDKVHFNKPNYPKKFYRKYKFVTDTPKGETKGIDILSSILFTRLTLPFHPNYESSINANLEQHTINFDISAAVLKLKDEQKCYELLEYYSGFLRNHISMLKTVASKNNSASSSKTSPISTKREAGYSQTVISYLQDIACIFSSQQSFPVVEENCINKSNSNSKEDVKVEAESSSHDLSSEVDLNANILTEILQSLSALANPETYPSGYSKNEEVEYSLSILLTICSACPEKFLKVIGELPIYAFLNPLQNISAICITIRLLIVLCCCKNFILFLTHRNSNCILCSIVNYLINIVPHYPENFAVSMTLVEDFLSLVFSTPNFLETLLDKSECISEVIQGIIVSVWKYCQVREKIGLSTEIIKKGFLLLHFISCCIPNFKERRNPVENEYISLMSKILALSKENNELREFYDLIHTLWDFQTDGTEFDLEDLSEEIQGSANDMDVN